MHDENDVVVGSQSPIFNFRYSNQLLFFLGGGGGSRGLFILVGDGAFISKVINLTRKLIVKENHIGLAVNEILL